MAMTPKNFLKKASSCKSAEGFLKQYREYLLTGELFPITTPIVSRVDAGDLLPTPALEELVNVVFAHVTAKDLAKAEASLNRAPSAPRATRSMKAITSTIYNGNDEEVESENHDLFQQGMRWADRHLISSATDCYAKVVHNRVLIKGQKMEEFITREDAYYRSFPKKHSPIMKRSPRSLSSLKGQMKVSQSRANFSHG